MKIGLLGSSFDPPHKGHMRIAKQVKKLLELDAVWLLPDYRHAFGKKQTSHKHRLSMVKLLENDEMVVSLHEIRKKNTSYTYDTLHELTRMYPQHTFYWILGSDQIEVFHKYKNWREIIKQFLLVVFPRETTLIKLKKTVQQNLGLKKIPENIMLLDPKKLTLSSGSSSAIRQRVKEGKSIVNLVPEAIKEYIETHDLYR
jgi:nicotinate-nucleotide adenylyltransferase